MMTTWKLAPALAAGCTAVLKPDPQTPLTAIRLAEPRVRGRLPRRRGQRRPGDGPTTGAYLVRHPGVDKVALTGSTRTGRGDHAPGLGSGEARDARAGRQEPQPRFADADLASAIPSSAWAIFYAAGQSCEARSRLLVEQPLYDAVVSQMADFAGAIRVGDPLDAETQMGSLISTGHRDRVYGFVERSTDEGWRDRRRWSGSGRRGRVLPPDGRRRDERPRDRPGGGLRPGRGGDAVRGRGRGDQARERRPLRAHGNRLDRRSRAWPSRRGQDQVGDGRDQHAVHGVPGHPFGGYKQSGFGRELGLETLDLYLETKSVIVSTGSRPINPFGL